MTQLLGQVQFNDVQQTLISAFLKQTGYGERDILALNFSTKIFMTRNGGRYHLQENQQVKWIEGPPVDAEYRL